MENRQKPFWLVMLCMGIFFFACVTVNIYFPAEKVESAAGEIVGEVRGKGSMEKEKPPKDDKGSFLRQTLLALSPSLAWAQEATTVSNPTIRALKQNLKNRFGQMKPYYQKGMLKEGDDGFVSIGSTQGLSLKEQRDLRNLVDAENRDRRTLYGEVAKALNIDPSQTNRVAQIFAKEWQKSVR